MGLDRVDKDFYTGDCFNFNFTNAEFIFPMRFHGNAINLFNDKKDIINSNISQPSPKFNFIPNEIEQ